MLLLHEYEMLVKEMDGPTFHRSLGIMLPKVSTRRVQGGTVVTSGLRPQASGRSPSLHGDHAMTHPPQITSCIASDNWRLCEKVLSLWRRSVVSCQPEINI